MEKKWIEHIRDAYGIPTMITDERLNQLEANLEHLPHAFDPIRVANLVELTELRRVILPDLPQLGVFPSGYDPLWQGCCERMFVEGFYGPCCIWARATVELLLQEKCLSNEGTSIAFKERVRCLNGRNPGIDWCLKILKGVLPDDDVVACKSIADNGDWVVHHRLDKISGGASLEDMLRGWGVSEEYVDRPEFKDNERFLRIANRYDKERDMAKSSMKELYGFLSRRTPPQSSPTF